MTKDIFVDRNAGSDHTNDLNAATPPPMREVPWLQIQNRLFQLATQIDHIQAQMERLAAETQTSGDQVAVLTRHLTDAQRSDLLAQRLAELATQLAAQEEQLAAIRQTLDSAASREQFQQLQQSVAQTAQRDQLERLAQAVANQEQVERLLQIVAHQQQVEQLEDALKKLGRTQFKTNTLGETREQQIASALTSLQEIATRREQTHTSQVQRTAQQLEEARGAARTQFAAELLPALDSLELALDQGALVLGRQRTQTETTLAAQANYLTALEQYVATESQPVQPAPSPGFWQRIFGSTPELPPPAPPPLPQPVQVADLQAALTSGHDTLHAWLRGLELVQERFVTLLAGEGIHEIDALNKPFDPRLHVAVEAETRSDAPANTVVRVVRKGYRQNDRVLRYAEVVVARQPAQAEPAEEQGEK
jgi:molecular chaperone GrpE